MPSKNQHQNKDSAYINVLIATQHLHIKMKLRLVIHELERIRLAGMNLRLNLASNDTYFDIEFLYFKVGFTGQLGDKFNQAFYKACFYH